MTNDKNTIDHQSNTLLEDIVKASYRPINRLDRLININIKLFQQSMFLGLISGTALILAEKMVSENRLTASAELYIQMIVLI